MNSNHIVEYLLSSDIEAIKLGIALVNQINPKDRELFILRIHSENFGKTFRECNRLSSIFNIYKYDMTSDEINDYLESILDDFSDDNPAGLYVYHPISKKFINS